MDGPRDLSQLRIVVEAAPLAMVMVDGAGRIALVNARAESLFGFAASELIGQSVERLVPLRFRNGHPRLRGEFLSAPAARLMGAGRDLFGIRKDGIEVPIEIGLHPIKSAEGFYVLAAIIDITERRRAEELQRSVVESAPNAIVMVDSGGRIALVNAQTELLFSYHRRDLLGEPVEKLVPERFRAGHGAHRTFFFTAPTTRAMGAGRELYGLRRDGSEFPLEIGLNPISTADGTFVLASIIDITERKRIDELQRLMVEAAPNAMVMVDGAGHIALVNAQAELLFGYTRREMIGQPVERLVPERFRTGHPALRADFMSSPTARPMGAARDLFGLRKDGAEIPIEIGLNPIRTSEGFFVLAAIIDITERKRTESLRLENVGVQLQNEQLESLNRELESFSYSVSHDLRSPARAIAGFALALEEDYGAGLDDEGRRLLAVVKNEAIRMGKLIDDLLEFSRLGRTSIETSMVNMSRLVSEICASVRAHAENVGVCFEVADLPPVVGDQILLRQVWDNLIANAVKYSQRRSAPLIRIGGEQQNGHVVYHVKDNGVGFDMRYYDRLFGVFQRLHHADEFPGSGVGLAIVQRILARLGGRVWAKSAPDEGAIFSFSLPAGEHS